MHQATNDRSRGSIRENKLVPADPGCSGIPGFPYTLFTCDVISEFTYYKIVNYN